jgi:hypothetical protein
LLAPLLDIPVIVVMRTRFASFRSRVVEPFREPPVNRSQKFASLLRLASRSLRRSAGREYSLKA